MRIWILSDLHLDVGGPPWSPPSIPDADLCIIAGDVGQGLVGSVRWVETTIRPHMPVVLVAGNHEFYGRVYGEELDHGREAAAMAGVLLLENQTVRVAGVSVSGCTLWTDYALDGEHRRASAMVSARNDMNDHRRISWTKRPVWNRFRPEEALALHLASRRFLREANAARDPAVPHVVVTHHAPHPRSVAPQFDGDPLNPAFASDLTDLLASGPTLWVHGHVHSRLDYRVAGARVVCNPKGYGRENPAFDPALVVEVGA